MSRNQEDIANQLAGNQAGVAELRSRLLFVLFALLVYRIGTHIPVPGIDPSQLQALFNQNQGGILELFNMFSGGAWERMSILALGVIPYITASISSEIPLPTPRSVICSPSHIIKMEPVTKVSAATKRNVGPVSKASP